MLVYRIAQEKYIRDLSGYGAFRHSGRWHTKGNHLIYTAESRALTALELIVRIIDIPVFSNHHHLLTLYIPDDLSMRKINVNNLPENWKQNPSGLLTRAFGDRFIRNNKFLMLKVPSVMIPGEFNYLINPNHSEIKKVKIKKVEPFHFDNRITKS